MMPSVKAFYYNVSAEDAFEKRYFRNPKDSEVVINMGDYSYYGVDPNRTYTDEEKQAVEDWIAKQKAKDTKPETSRYLADIGLPLDL